MNSFALQYIKKFVYPFIIVCMVIPGQFQTQTRPLPKTLFSPNISSLGQYSDVPTDLSTGKANVAIDLYQFNESNIPLEIKLRYDTGGVRVGDVSGWVGQNWTLEAGGVITRVVRGSSFDEKFTADIPNGASHWGNASGYFYYTSALNTTQWNNPTYMKSTIRAGGQTNGAKPAVDLEPDLFIFNFMGYSGKFFLGSDGEWKVSSSDNLKIDIQMSDKVVPMDFPATNNFNQRLFPKVLNKITITDDKGNRFVFGGKHSAIEYNFPDFFNQLVNPVVSSAWHLSEVFNRQGELIYSFNYEQGDYSAMFYPTNSFSNFSKTFQGDIFNPSLGCTYGTAFSNKVRAKGQLIIPTFLKSIKTRAQKEVILTSTNSNALKYQFNSGDVPIDNVMRDVDDILVASSPNGAAVEDAMFYYSKRLLNGVTPNPEISTATWSTYFNSLKWKKLDRIQVKSSKGEIIKRIDFSYNNIPNSRLKLEMLTVDLEEKYAFRYNEFEDLPRYLSSNIDHFGYFKSTPFTLDYNHPELHEASRATDPNRVGYGSLASIRFPMGGYRLFTYEPHTYSNSVNHHGTLVPDQGVIGGLRIRKIIDLTEDLQKTEREFQYTVSIDSPISSGILLQKNVYYIKNYLIPSENNVPYYETNFNISSVIPLSNSLGPNIQYSSVIEKRANQGYFLFNYTTYADFPDAGNSGQLGQEVSVFEPHNDYSYKRSLLKSKKTYNSVNLLLEEDLYNYAETVPKSVRALSFKYFLVCPISSGQAQEYLIAGNAYEMFFSDYNLISIDKRVHHGSESINFTNTYNYQDLGTFGDQLLRQERRQNSDGQWDQNNYLYVNDHSNVQPYTFLNSKRVFAITDISKSKNQFVAYKQKTNYGTASVLNENGTFGEDIYPIAELSAKGENPYVSKIWYDWYDSYGNLIKSHNESGQYLYTFYGYKSRFPIVQIQGLQIVNEGSLIIQVNNLKSMLINGGTSTQIESLQNSIRKGFPTHKMIFNTFDEDFEVTSSAMFQNGETEYYEYDQKGRLTLVEDFDKVPTKKINYQISSRQPEPIYMNQTKSAKYARQNCPMNFYGTTVNYIVEQGKHFSFESLNDANSKAQTDLYQNGQDYANANGTCVSFNCSISGMTSYPPYNYGSISILSANLTYRVQVGFTTGTGLPWQTTGVVIARINGTCRPSVVRNSSAYSKGIWTITITPDGYIRAKLASTGSGAPTIADNLPIDLDFQFPSN
ncbi:DUF5977 domain-containing protein [Chryseobacterium sp. A301]